MNLILFNKKMIKLENQINHSNDISKYYSSKRKKTADDMKII